MIGNRHNRGQVLLLSVVIMIVLMLMVLILFDVHVAIRAKMKVETAEQAAALTAAEWQRNSLNLIGELNLVKASEAMLESYVPSFNLDEQTREQEKIDFIRASCRAMTEMQSRISFIGPLIAFGAAQQAAKYNGISIFDSNKDRKLEFFDENEETYRSASSEDADKKYIYDDIRNYRRRIETNPRYENYEYCNYYAWREPYLAMLEDIRQRGMVVRGTGISYMNQVNPPWLAYKSVYEVVLELHENGTENIAGVLLKNWGILKLPESFWEGDWWKVSFALTGFGQQSEIYSLYVTFGGYNSGDETLETIYEYFVGGEIPMLESKYLSYLRWCIFRNEWIPDSDTLEGPWYDKTYLRDVIKDSFKYEGALAVATTYERIKTLSTHEVDMDISSTSAASSPETTPTRSSTDPFRINTSKHVADAASLQRSAQKTLQKGTVKSAILKKRDNMSFVIGSDLRNGNEGGVVAKVVGQLDASTPPHSANLVLPSFHSVTMVPSTMYGYSAFRSDYDDLERFLIWLSNLESFDPATILVKQEDGEEILLPVSPPSGTEKYYQALLILREKDFRKSMWNLDFKDNYPSFDECFEHEYKYDPLGSLEAVRKGERKTTYGINPDGAGWLQQYYVGPRPGETARENLLVKHPRDPDNRNSEFLVSRTSGSKYLTNEEYYLYTYYKPPSNPSYYHGGNTGPPRL